MMGRLPGQSMRGSSICQERLWVPALSAQRVQRFLKEGRPGSAKSRRGAPAFRACSMRRWTGATMFCRKQMSAPMIRSCWARSSGGDLVEGGFEGLDRYFVEVGVVFEVGEDLGVDVDGDDFGLEGAGAEDARQTPAAAGVEDAEALGHILVGEEVGQ